MLCSMVLNSVVLIAVIKRLESNIWESNSVLLIVAVMDITMTRPSSCA
jgi:hypothetical protein